MGNLLSVKQVVLYRTLHHQHSWLCVEHLLIRMRLRVTRLVLQCRRRVASIKEKNGTEVCVGRRITLIKEETWWRRVVVFSVLNSLCWKCVPLCAVNANSFCRLLLEPKECARQHDCLLEALQRGNFCHFHFCHLHNYWKLSTAPYSWIAVVCFG